MGKYQSSPLLFARKMYIQIDSKKASFLPKNFLKKSDQNIWKFHQNTLSLHPQISRFSFVMNIQEFSDIFLPHLVILYVDGQLPLHGLVDIDTWRRVFPETEDGPADQIHWYQITITCNHLQDGSLLFSFILPQPQQRGQAKFAAIRLKPQAAGETCATYYTLCKPVSIDDDWDIFYLALPVGRQKKELKFCRKVEGTDSLRNFVLTVQQTPFYDSNYGKTAFDHIRDFFARARSVQD